jgi:preprotein translocase subunit SecG
MRIIQIIIAVAVIVFILLQARGAGLGSVFGGSSAGSVFKTRRGVERLIFNITVVLVILFALVSVASVVIH